MKHTNTHTHKPLNKDGLRSLVDVDNRFEFDRVADVTNEVVLSAVQGSSQVLKKVDEAVGVYALFVQVWMCEVDVLKTGVTQHHPKIINICRDTDIQHHLMETNKH